MAVFEQAAKIWIDTADRVNVYADFTDAFTLPETFETVTLSVSADSNYLVTVNGRVVGSLQYADFPTTRCMIPTISRRTYVPAKTACW